MCDGNFDGGKYSSDEAIAVVLFVFDTHATEKGRCLFSPSFSGFSTHQRDFYVSSPPSSTRTTDGHIDRGGYPPIRILL
jgi:hypothetical protein